MTLFDSNLSYPSDREGGRYVEFTGPVLAVGEDMRPLDDMFEAKITVQTPKGVFSGYCRWPRHDGMFKPEVGMQAEIRIYDAGGGWYPDNKIMRMNHLA